MPAVHAGARRLSYNNLQRDASAAAKWKVRHNILEAVTELIDELQGIQQQARTARLLCAQPVDVYEIAAAVQTARLAGLRASRAAPLCPSPLCAHRSASRRLSTCTRMRCVVLPARGLAHRR